MRPSSERRAGAPQRLVRGGERRGRRGPTARAAGRTPGRRSAARGSGGRADRHTRPGSRAHREAAHRGVRPVVGHRVDDAEPRPAVRAVGEGIAIAAIGGIANLGQAVVAGGDVGHHQRPGAALSSLSRMLKPLRDRVEPHRLEAVDDGAWRASRSSRSEARLERRPRALELGEHALRGVDHPAVEPEVARPGGRRTAGSRPPAPPPAPPPADVHAGRRGLPSIQSHQRQCPRRWCRRSRRSAGPD